jgi:hypothetical protein
VPPNRRAGDAGKLPHLLFHRKLPSKMRQSLVDITV